MLSAKSVSNPRMSSLSIFPQLLVQYLFDGHRPALISAVFPLTLPKRLRHGFLETNECQFSGFWPCLLDERRLFLELKKPMLLSSCQQRVCAVFVTHAYSPSV